MDIQISHRNDKDALQLKSSFIITLLDLIAGGVEGLGNDEKGIIDECIRHIYDDYFISGLQETRDNFSFCRERFPGPRGTEYQSVWCS